MNSSKTFRKDLSQRRGIQDQQAKKKPPEACTSGGLKTELSARPRETTDNVNQGVALQQATYPRSVKGTKATGLQQRNGTQFATHGATDSIQVVQ
jgi:hypothetical protein